MNTPASIPFALETLPLHYSSVPKGIIAELEGISASLPAISAKTSRPLRFFHHRRLCHSCRLLSFAEPPVSIWRELEALRHKLSKVSAETERQIYSLRYFASVAAADSWLWQQSQQLVAQLVYRKENWLLLRRSNPYSFENKMFGDSDWLPAWAALPRVAIAPLLRVQPNELGQSSPANRLWIAKCHWQAELAQQLAKLKEQVAFQDCEDLLCFSQPGPNQRPRLLEGMKSNVFLLRYSKPILQLYTPCAQRSSPAMLCGTSRNWLYHAAKALPLIEVIPKDLGLDELIQADGLLLCNAAMGLRLVCELRLEMANCHWWAEDVNLALKPPFPNVVRYNLEAEAWALLQQLQARYWAARF